MGVHSPHSGCYRDCINFSRNLFLLGVSEASSTASHDAATLSAPSAGVASCASFWEHRIVESRCCIANPRMVAATIVAFASITPTEFVENFTDAANATSIINLAAPTTLADFSANLSSPAAEFYFIPIDVATVITSATSVTCGTVATEDSR